MYHYDSLAKYRRDSGWVNPYLCCGEFIVPRIVEGECVVIPGYLSIVEQERLKAKASKEVEVEDPDEEEAKRIIDEYTEYSI